MTSASLPPKPEVKWLGEFSPTENSNVTVSYEGKSYAITVQGAKTEDEVVKFALEAFALATAYNVGGAKNKKLTITKKFANDGQLKETEVNRNRSKGGVAKAIDKAEDVQKILEKKAQQIQGKGSVKQDKVERVKKAQDLYSKNFPNTKVDCSPPPRPSTPPPNKPPPPPPQSQPPIQPLTLPKTSNVVLAQYQIGQTTFRIMQGDLFDTSCQVLTNAANDHLKAGGGVCGFVKTKAGEGPFNECKEIKKGLKKDSIATGQAVLTGKGNLPNAYVQAIVHAVGPDARSVRNVDERAKLLREAYQNSLKLISPGGDENLKAQSMKGKTLNSIAFPSLSTGIFEYPIGQAAQVAVEAIKDHMEAHKDTPMVIEIIVPKKSKEISAAYLKEANEQFLKTK